METETIVATTFCLACLLLVWGVAIAQVGFNIFFFSQNLALG